MYTYFKAHLERLGFKGCYCNKAHTTTPLGNAIFWKEACFEVTHVLDLDLTMPLKGVSNHPVSMSIHSLLEREAHLKLALSKTTTVGNLVTLKWIDEPGKSITLVNHHLFGDQAAPHIRLIQLSLALVASEEALERERGEGREGTILFTGDFNSRREAGGLELLLQGSIAEDHHEWEAIKSFRWRDLGQKMRLEQDSDAESTESIDDQEESTMSCTCSIVSRGILLFHPYKFSLATEELPYSYIAEDSVWPCDHVLFEPCQLHLERCLPLPTKEQAIEWAAPSTQLPSDHVAVVLDFARVG